MTVRSAVKRLLPTGRWQKCSPRSVRSYPHHPVRSLTSPAIRETYGRRYRVLAIETSCDDTSVAVVTARKLDPPNGVHVPCPRIRLQTHFHERVTANNDAHGGIHPLVALDSHRANTAPLVRQAMRALEQAPTVGTPEISKRLDLVAVTRGPGMRSNLSVGLDTAKGIAAALNIPLIGVHHMQAHALTPRLMAAMANERVFGASTNQLQAFNEPIASLKPTFPFLSLLVSGGHTMLLDSMTLAEHHILAATADIAVGQLLDKAARVILPVELLSAPYGRALENFAFRTVTEVSNKQVGLSGQTAVGNAEPSYEYSPPKTHHEVMMRRPSEWGWALPPPLAERAGGESKRMEYTFTGLLTSVERLIQRRTESGGMTMNERQALAREVQRVAFEHLASRLLVYLTSPASNDWKGDTIVISGGVAANGFLRHILRRSLDVRGFEHINLSSPPVELATDNALMVAWAAIEMFDAGWKSTLNIGPIRKWSMDVSAPDGGILGVDGWVKHHRDNIYEA